MKEKIDIETRGYDRITEILSPFTGIEFVPEHILKKACDRGTEAHKYIELILSGWGVKVIPESIRPYVDSFNKFWDDQPEFMRKGEIILEERLFCDDLLITGKPDMIVKCEDKTYIMDWKTSSRMHKSWYLQGAAYRHLCEKSGYKNVQDTLFVKLSKEGKKAGIYKNEDYLDNIDVFFKCVDIYRWFDMKKTRRQDEKY